MALFDNIRSDIRRAVKSMSFLAGIMITLISTVFSRFVDIGEASDSSEILLPVIATIPFAVSFVDEVKSGFIKSYLSRTTRKKYIISKLIAAAFSGGLVTLSFAGGLWAMVGFVLASATMNRYIAYSAPFILYYVLVILHERYFPAFDFLSPNEWSFREYTVLAILLSVGFALYARRKLYDT
jgi:hypothetical protein